MQARPREARGIEASLADDLNVIMPYARQVRQDRRPIRYFAEDESRFGLKTLLGRVITACGVKPMGIWQWLFKAFWIYGVVEPATGDRFFLQFSHVDTD